MAPAEFSAAVALNSRAQQAGLNSIGFAKRLERRVTAAEGLPHFEWLEQTRQDFIGDFSTQAPTDEISHGQAEEDVDPPGRD
jgi:hypothetical protein